MVEEPVTDLDLERFVEEAVTEKGHSELEPVFYSISGSHLYGFPNPSDIDLRGFHVAPAKSHLKLSEPKEQIVVNQGTETQGFEEWSEVDLVSYELKKFGHLLFKTNFNVLELVLGTEPVINEVPRYIEDLRETLEKYLPGDVATTYRGMAYNHYNQLKRRKEPSVKEYLYTARGFLGAIHVSREKDIEPNISELTYRHCTDAETVTVNKLLDAKRDGKSMNQELRKEVEDLLSKLETRMETYFVTGSMNGLRTDLDNWMLNLRLNG